jgi:hypothetical protein
MERDNFRIIKNEQELMDVKYIRKKGLKIRITGTRGEISINKEVVESKEIYIISLDGLNTVKLNTMYEAVAFAIFLIRDEQEKIENLKIQEIENKKIIKRNKFIRFLLGAITVVVLGIVFVEIFL